MEKKLRTTPIGAKRKRNGLKHDFGFPFLQKRSEGESKILMEILKKVQGEKSQKTEEALKSAV
jgi:hypothetical protein